MFRKLWKGNVGHNIRRIRLARRMTQEGAAEVYHCTVRHWQRLEDGTQNPSLVVLVKIAWALRIPPAQLLAWTSAGPRPFLIRAAGRP